MYTEEPRRNIDWGNIIKKGLIFLAIAAVVFLIIWLFARNNSNSINVDYGNGNSEIINSDAYSESFIDNYRYFHDTAKEYFLISELPAKGETLKYTLQELINKNLILPMSYGEGTCDTEASYATVTNNNGKYTMTVTLVCGTEVAKTTEELGCNQLCEDGTCTTPSIEETIYQYKQAYETTEIVYECPSGYTKTGSGENTKCVKDNSSTIRATKHTTYICKDGYTKIGSGSNTKCVKENTTTIDATKKTIYICPDDYVKTGSGENTRCYKKSEDFVKAEYKYVYSCPSGYNQSGSGENTKCTKVVNDSYTATATTNYICEKGYTKTGNGENTKCVKNDSYDATAKTTYSCPNGGSESNGKCYTTDSYTATANTSYTCSKGDLVNEKYCRIYSTKSYYQTYTIYKGKSYNGCSYSGTYTDTCSSYSGCTRTYYKYYCTKSSYKDVEATAKTTYSCPNGGSESNGKCYITDSYTATANTSYSCPNGGTLDKNNKCVTTDTQNPTVEINHSCPNGGTLDGNKCITTETKSTTPNKSKSYYCKNDDYVLDGKYCYKTTEDYQKAKKEIRYICPEDYKKIGSGENTKCKYTGITTVKAVKNTTYICPDGYNKIGIGSESKCTKGATTTINPTKSTKTVTKYRYKCSKETSLEGWERTGKTCKTETSSK